MSLNGLDAASYQSGLDIAEVPGDFAIIKATEGINYDNPTFSGHVKQTLVAGKKLGVYHFIRNDSDIKEQADYFLAKVKPYIGKAILALDFENTTGSTIQNQAGVGLAKQWLDYVYGKTGVRPLLYTGIGCENSLDWSSVVRANYGLWLAQYNLDKVVNGYAPRDLYGSLKHWKSMVIFQYASVGRLSGYSSDLDLDVFYGDKAAWDKYAKATKVPETDNPTTNPSEPSGAKWVKENKSYMLKTTVKLRTAPSTDASVIAALPAGSTVKTDQAIIQGGYRWVRQPRSNGYGYLATGPASNTLEYVETSASHTYYEVVSGDSWWSIAQRNGLSMTTLAAQNGKSIYSTIYPGDKLLIK
ncbi:GH25 family lysozyme [Lactiplantibacillus plantarum]|uniref:GH25 family lysozyme n=1 Tax=Lactiplantibacillus plantarum TaxID=1590 RepID=UPI00073ADB02|nr:GH25 family lysozyme [Lactiplantibacillus plantarum]ALV14331.1 phage lysin [Lactiplantibacillus plantarum]AYA96415.1 LysM peptidoglycan-binding domain-containing protein [Lactiplantibacillus plantarum]AYG35259.1 LysM peptidoglycan-binding domain-containing protein [Lactiplantibacillus plantarum]KZU55179.1 Lysin [Lactiplantibacillus plantarum]QIL58088.1 LysM peptidoglycan-binding domain-containing protein [Lactiplantibacillus plantarum]